MNLSSNRARRRAAAAAGALLVTTLVTAGCGTQIRGGGDDDANATLTYWSAWNVGEAQQEIFETVRTAFTEETGIEIEVQYLGRQVTQNLINALGNGTGPDLFDAGSRNILDYEGRGFLADLDELMETDIPGEDISVGESFTDAVREAASGEEGVGILPTYVNSSAIWFDASQFPELESDPPEDWDDFIALLDEQKAEGLTPLGADGTVPSYNVFWLYQLLVQAEGPGALRSLAEAPENWDQPYVLEAAQRVQQIVDGGYLQTDYMGTKYPDAQNQWAQGAHSFMLGGSYMEGETRDQQKDGFTARTFMFPSVPGGTPTVEVTASGLAINADSKNLDAANQFLAFAAQEKFQKLYASEAGFIAARAGVEQPEPLRGLVEQIENADSVTQSHDLAAALHPTWWNDILLPLDDALFSGTITAEEFVARGKEQTAAYLAANG